MMLESPVEPGEKGEMQTVPGPDATRLRLRRGSAERSAAVLLWPWRHELSKRITAAGRSGSNVSTNSMRPWRQSGQRCCGALSAPAVSFSG